ncbi:MAG: response regulator, partial [Bacilli bacterium]|nr:response regulator [Bacilli bacterium]
MNVFLVDDEPLQLLRLEKAVKEVLPDATLSSFSNSVEAAKSAKERTVDLAFLDIEMPGINGIELAEKIKASSPKANIIFVTAYDHYALEAHRLHSSGYVTKPVNKNKVAEEIKHLRYPIESTKTKKLQIKCFGNFDVFCDGEPLRFSYKKSKEAFAYLVDREGSAISVNELNAILWEEDHPSYLRNLIVDIQNTLRKAGVGDVFIKRHNECFIDVTKVDCDAYEYKKNNPDAVRQYRGEYMIQYDWAFFHAN